MVKIIKYIEITHYCMVGERVRFLCMSRERLQTNEWAKRTSEFNNLSQQVHNENRTNEPTSQQTNQVSYFLRHFIFFVVQQKIPAKVQTRKWRFHFEGSLIIIHHEANKKEFLS